MTREPCAYCELWGFDSDCACQQITDMDHARAMLRVVIDLHEQGMKQLEDLVGQLERTREAIQLTREALDSIYSQASRIRAHVDKTD